MKKALLALVLLATSVAVSGCFYPPYGYGRPRPGFCVYHPYRC